MRVKVLLSVALLLVIAAILLMRPAGTRTEAAKDFAIDATPPGVTMEPPARNTPIAGGRPTSVTPGFLADASGMALYVYGEDSAPGKSACAGDCATAWPPMQAPAGAMTGGDWSVIDRGDGVKQWAYRGKPLYRSAKDSKPGDTSGNGADGKWRLAIFAQTPDEVASPAGISLKVMASAGGDTFVDYRGMTLYVFDGDQSGKPSCVDACLKIWSPLIAGELAKPIGDWTTAERADGSRQWAYKGRPVYDFSGDFKPGDANGVHADPQWHAALLRRYFMPAQVSMRFAAGWPILTTADGMTLYARDQYRYPGGGGFSVNDGPPPTPAVGRAIGTDACPGGACPDVWTPLKADPNTQPSGYWTILQRADGTRQWAYQGYALYTNAEDKKPGDMLGRDIFDLTDGSHALYWRLAMP